MIQRLFFELRYLLGNAPWDSGVSPPELVEFLSNHDPGTALDLGCGTGTNAVTMARHGWKVTGIDLSWLALWKARRKGRALGSSVRFLRGDATRLLELPLRPPYDFCLDIGCYHTLLEPGQSRYASQVKAVLKPGAHYLLYAFFNEQVNRATIRSHFQPEFQIYRLQEGSDTPSGRDSAWTWMERVQP